METESLLALGIVTSTVIGVIGTFLMVAGIWFDKIKPNVVTSMVFCTLWIPPLMWAVIALMGD